MPARFFLAGLAFLGLLLLISVWKAQLMTSDYLHNPATLAVTHLFTLGLGSTVVTGALYQMIPVLLYSSLFSERLADIHLAVHAAGLLLMVAGFLWFEPTYVALGGSLVVTGALLFVGNVGATFARAERWNWHGIYMVAAVLFYLTTITWGLVLAFNQKYGFLGEVEGAPLTGHITLGFLGWFSLMIISAGLKLLPMFAPAKVLPAPLVAATGAGLTLGVLITLTGLWAGRAILWTGACITGAALTAYAAQIGYSYLHRRAGPLDFSVRYALTASFIILLPLAGMPWANREWQAALVFLFGLGFVGGTILGMLLRIIPFMVWLHRFRNRTHKLEKTPFLHELFQRRLGWVAYLTWFPAAGLMAAGIGCAAPPLVIAGAVAGLAGLGAYAAALRQMLHHIPPGTPPLFPGKK